MNVTNKYLKSSISEISNFFRNNTNPPEDMYMNLIMELRVSDLMMPVSFDGEKFTFPTIDVDDGTNLLPLFTSDEELKKYSKDFESISNDLPFFIRVVNDHDLDGILIDLGSDEFCVENELLNKIEFTKKRFSEHPYEPEELRDMALGQRNDKLRSFIQDESNFNNFDDLSELLVETPLLTVVASEDDLSEFVKDGIIDRNEASTFSIFTMPSGSEHYGTVYTDTDAIVEFHETVDLDYYVQVTNKFIVFHFILSNDLDGIIINPGTDDYYVPRQVILRLLNEKLVDPHLEYATRYAFPIE